MTTKKGTSIKLFRYIISFILILVIAAATIGCRQGNSSSEQQAKTALEQLLSCTLQQAEDFDTAITETVASIEAEADSEIGLAQGDDTLKDHLIERFGDSMTTACIEDLAMSRTFYQSIELAKSLSSDIEASEVELTKRSDEPESYSFSAKIKTSEGKTAATASGSISMEKDGTERKASMVTLTMDET